jgi:hypothetical protein
MLRDFVGMIESRPLCLVTLAPRPDVVAAREATRAKSAAVASAPAVVENMAATISDTTPKNTALREKQRTLTTDRMPNGAANDIHETHIRADPDRPSERPIGRLSRLRAS